MSCRKSAWLICMLAGVLLKPAAGMLDPLTGFVVDMLYLYYRMARSGPELQGGEHQFLGGVQNLHVVLVCARGRDHVRHLFDDVDVRRVDIAVFVRERIAWVVPFGRRGIVLHDPRDSHRCTARSVGRVGALSDSRLHCLEHGMAGLIDSAWVATDAVRVGQVAGHGVQPHGLCAEARTNDVKY